MDVQTGNALLDSTNPYQAVSTQDPEKIGYQSVEAAVQVLQGEEVESEIIVDLDVFTKDDKEKVQQYVEKYSNI